MDVGMYVGMLLCWYLGILVCRYVGSSLVLAQTLGFSLVLQLSFICSRCLPIAPAVFLNASSSAPVALSGHITLSFLFLCPDMLMT
jgi:hypothetical protein